MRELIRPNRLRQGDKIVTVSLSWGGAGDDTLLWRYRQGAERLKNEFGLHVVEMPHTLKGTEYVYHHPQVRAKDFMDAFADSSVKAIFSCIGGDDSIRMLPYIDYERIRNNPKIFMGYSDSTVTHFICMKAGISSYYGPSVLAEFAENVAIPDYTKNSVVQTLFHPHPIGVINPAETWTGEYLAWDEVNKQTQRRMSPNRAAECLQGNGTVRGHLIGGCMDVMEMIKGTEIWPDDSVWNGAILFLETSEDMPTPEQIRYWLRNYAACGVLNGINGIIWGKPYQMKYYEEYKEEILKVLAEYELKHLPVLYGLNFGHTTPMFVIPYGAEAQICCERNELTILSQGVE